jgi:hypothetical protein
MQPLIYARKMQDLALPNVHNIESDNLLPKIRKEVLNFRQSEKRLMNHFISRFLLISTCKHVFLINDALKNYINMNIKYRLITEALH